MNPTPLTDAIPEDFPRNTFPGAVPGAQPKFLARRIDGKYVAGLTDAELAERYDVCLDLLAQLVPYAKRKLADPGGSRDAVMARIREGIRSLDTGLSPQEVEWLVKRVIAALG